MRILLLNLGSASLEAAQTAVGGQGHEIAKESTLTVEGVLALSPDAIKHFFRHFLSKNR